MAQRPRPVHEARRARHLAVLRVLRVHDASPPVADANAVAAAILSACPDRRALFSTLVLWGLIDPVEGDGWSRPSDTAAARLASELLAVADPASEPDSINDGA